MVSQYQHTHGVTISTHTWCHNINTHMMSQYQHTHGVTISILQTRRRHSQVAASRSLRGDVSRSARKFVSHAHGHQFTRSTAIGSTFFAAPTAIIKGGAVRGVSASEASKHLDCRFSSPDFGVRLDLLLLLPLRLARLLRELGFVRICALLPGCRWSVTRVLA